MTPYKIGITYPDGTKRVDIWDSLRLAQMAAARVAELEIQVAIEALPEAGGSITLPGGTQIFIFAVVDKPGGVR